MPESLFNEAASDKSRASNFLSKAVWHNQQRQVFVIVISIKKVFLTYCLKKEMAETFTTARPQTTPQQGLHKAGILSLRWTGFLFLGTYYFTQYYLGPAIVGLFSRS